MPGTVKRKRTIVRSHWAKLIENFNTSSQDFYQKVEAALEKREVPGLESSRVEWSEGGLLSAKRIYLRLVRQRVVIDICAAPFGTGYFFSWRLGEVPLKIRWGLLLLGVLALLLIWYVLMQMFGEIGGTVAMPILALVGVVLTKSVFKNNAADLDALLMKVPGVGDLYESYLRRVTYYRIDLMMMYEQAVHAAVMEAIDEVTSAQGVASLTEADRKPIMRDVYAKAR